MANPALSRNPAFQDRGYATFNNTPSAPQYGAGAPQFGTQTAPEAASADKLEAMYGAGTAGPLQTGRMTYDDVIVKTGICFAVLLVGALVSWSQAGTGLGFMLMVGGAIGAFVLGLVNAFKKNPSPALILAYAGLQGLFVGGFSALLERQFTGIVIQAVVATLCVFGAMLVGFKSGKFRTSPRLNKMFMIALGGYMLFSLVNLGLMLFTDVGGQFGLRSGPLGIAIGLFAVALASYSLIMDFEMVENGVKGGAPAKFAWAAAFGLMVTIVWLYIEILRIIAILRGGD